MENKILDCYFFIKVKGYLVLCLVEFWGEICYKWVNKKNIMFG